MEQQKSKYIPDEAYLYFPPPNEVMNAKGRHEIFGGNVKYTDFEQNKIQEFKAFAAKNNFPLRQDYWSDSDLLRFLTADEFKMSRTLEDVKEHSYWRDTLCPIQLSDRLKNFLNDGLLYIHGRDNKFRPIIVFNVNRIDAKQFDLNFMITAMTFWLKTIINEWMLPGQVEQWVFIGNIKGMGIGALAVQEVRKLFEFLQTNFKCRLHKIYLVNAARTVYAPWKIAKKFLDGDTVEKVHFYKSSVPEDLFNSTNREQVEQQFGGTAPNCTQYWPPKVVSNNYFVSPSDRTYLKSPEQYAQLYQSGALKGLTINEAFIQGSKMSQSANITRPTEIQQQVAPNLSQSVNITKPGFQTQGTLEAQFPTQGGYANDVPIDLATKSLGDLELSGGKNNDRQWLAGLAESQPNVTMGSLADFYDKVVGEGKDAKKEEDIPFDELPWDKKLELWRGFSSQADFVDEMEESAETGANLEKSRVKTFTPNVKPEELAKSQETSAI